MAKRNSKLNFLEEAKAEAAKIAAGTTDNTRLMNIFSLMTEAELEAWNDYNA